VKLINVLMVTGAYYPEVSGGGLQCRTLIRALKDRVRFIVFTTTTAPTVSLEEEVDGVPVYRSWVEIRRLGSKLRAGLRLAKLFWQLRRQFHVVHLHGFSKKSFLFFLLARATGKKLVLKMTSAGYDDPLTLKARSWLAFQIFSRVDCTVSVSPMLSELYRQSRLPLARLRTIPNGVDPERFHPVTPEERCAIRRELALPQESPIILFVGFFSRDKGPDLLFDAWKRIRAINSFGAGLVFVGATRSSYFEVDSFLASKIRAEALALGAEKEVAFVDRALDIQKYYSAADIFVLPSTREGLPNALLEAMASGLPCVATSLSGVTDWLIRHGENGLIFPPGDAVALSDRLLQLLSNPEDGRALGERARETVLEQCSIHKVKEAYLDLYCSLARGA
jgi:glycosyltransferase involved in cell wall biosynthesis